MEQERNVGQQADWGVELCAFQEIVETPQEGFPEDSRNCTLHKMKRYTAAEARQQLSHLLDAAERGESVVIERRGVRFRIRAERQSGLKAMPRHAQVIEFVDPAVAAGRWSWNWGPKGLRFVSAKREHR